MILKFVFIHTISLTAILNQFLSNIFFSKYFIDKVFYQKEKTYLLQLMQNIVIVVIVRVYQKIKCITFGLKTIQRTEYGC